VRLALTLAVLSCGVMANARERREVWWSYLEEDERFAKLIANPPYLSAARLPKGMRIGRCLLVVNGQTRISGRCAYSYEPDGGFYLTGPRQVYEGVDYPQPNTMASMISTDWWATVFRQDGAWAGYSNEVIRSVHGHESRWGELVRNGACYSNRNGPEVVQLVRVCLWKK
jgi:hypothetical protein